MRRYSAADRPGAPQRPAWRAPRPVHRAGRPGPATVQTKGRRHRVPKWGTKTGARPDARLLPPALARAWRGRNSSAVFPRSARASPRSDNLPSAERAPPRRDSGRENAPPAATAYAPRQSAAPPRRRCCTGAPLTAHSRHRAPADSRPDARAGAAPWADRRLCARRADPETARGRPAGSGARPRRRARRRQRQSRRKGPLRRCIADHAKPDHARPGGARSGGKRPLDKIPPGAIARGAAAEARGGKSSAMIPPRQVRIGAQIQFVSPG